MNSVISKLCKLTEFDINIFVTCLVGNTPSYDKGLDYGPLSPGKNFGKEISSLFDGVCYVDQRTTGNSKCDPDKGDIEEGSIIYPAFCYWVSPEKNFMAKKPKIGMNSITRLNWTTILNLINKKEQ